MLCAHIAAYVCNILLWNSEHLQRKLPRFFGCYFLPHLWYLLVCWSAEIRQIYETKYWTFTSSCVGAVCKCLFVLYLRKCFDDDFVCVAQTNVLWTLWRIRRTRARARHETTPLHRAPRRCPTSAVYTIKTPLTRYMPWWCFSVWTFFAICGEKLWDLCCQKKLTADTRTQHSTFSVNARCFGSRTQKSQHVLDLPQLETWPAKRRFAVFGYVARLSASTQCRL